MGARIHIVGSLPYTDKGTNTPQGEQQAERDTRRLKGPSIPYLHADSWGGLKRSGPPLGQALQRAPPSKLARALLFSRADSLKRPLEEPLDYRTSSALNPLEDLWETVLLSPGSREEKWRVGVFWGASLAMSLCWETLWCSLKTSSCEMSTCDF